MQGLLVLADGTVFKGKAFGSTKTTASGEVVFNTSMTGYQEILTDPSYCGQIITMTYPLIGNYGINPEDFESRKPFARGLIVREYCSYPSNWRATSTLDDFLKENDIIGLSEIDTRALTKHLRDKGTMTGIITTENEDIPVLIERAKQAPSLEGIDYVNETTTPKAYEVPGKGKHVAVLDLGAKQSIIRALENLGCQVTVLPADTRAADILALNPNGVLFTNGPGDPKAVTYAIQTARDLLGKIPLFGICLGHQIFALALGADTYKLPFGHRGANHPVKDLSTGKVTITSQNHGFAIKEKTLENLDLEITHRSLNDNTVEGIKHKKLPLFSVQYHPEAYPGPTDSLHLFDRFMEMMV